MNDLFTMRTYIQNDSDEEGGKKLKKLIGKTRIKTPFGYPHISPTMMWRADCFPVSTRTKNKLDYPYVGSGSKVMGQKKCKERHGKEWVAWITVMWVQDFQKDGTESRLRW